MKDKPANLPASILARLRNIARDKQTDNQLILRRYAIERLLYRLSISPHRDQFILKGAMLFTAWLNDPFRPTQDLDLLGFGNPAVTAIRSVFETICRIEAERDGLVYDAIREGQQYGGVRVQTTAFLGRTRIPVQVDIGFGDTVTPTAQELEFPSLLSAEGPRLRAYPRETCGCRKTPGNRRAWPGEQSHEGFLRPAGAVAAVRVRRWDRWSRQSERHLNAVTRYCQRRLRLDSVPLLPRTARRQGNGRRSSEGNRFSCSHRISRPRLASSFFRRSRLQP